MEIRELVLKCAGFADDKKAENITILDMREVSSITDYFVIASGNSDPQVRAIADEIERGMREECETKVHLMEKASHAWIVLDYFDFIVHVMRRDVRDKFDLEGLWGDAKRIKFEPEQNPSVSS